MANPPPIEARWYKQAPDRYLELASTCCATATAYHSRILLWIFQIQTGRVLIHHDQSFNGLTSGDLSKLSSRIPIAEWKFLN